MKTNFELSYELSIINHQWEVKIYKLDTNSALSTKVLDNLNENNARMAFS